MTTLTDYRANAQGVVAAQFAQAQTYANNAQVALTGFTDALNSSIYTPPVIDVTWNSLAAPDQLSLPSVPAMPAIEFLAPGAPASLVLTAPDLTIDAFGEAAPVTVMPDAPVVSYGLAPVVPGVADIAMPDAPLLAMPDAPTYLALSTHMFGGIDLHTDYLARLEDIPTLSLATPSSYSYARGADYASGLLSALKARLLERMAGGTGLAPAVEQALWDRARSRETKLGLANQAEIMRQSEAFGFQLPSGVLAAQLREARQGYYDKLSGLSRDVAIKQAEMEQENLKQTIAQGMELEGKLIDYAFKLEQIAFEAAKTYADNAIAIYNAQIDKFKALLTGYQIYAASYETLIKGELAKVEVFKAQLQGEQIKADINKTLVEQYKASIEAGMSQVKIFEAQIGAANSLVQIEQVKISAAGEQIKAYAAQVNAETSKVEAYKASVSAESLKVELYKSKAQAYGVVTAARAEKSRAEISYYSAMVQAKASEWDGYKAQIDGERARMGALSTQSTALLDGYKAATGAIEAQATLSAKVWETEIKQYEASVQVAIQAGKVNADSVIATNGARMDAAKAGAQVYAQLTSSAYGMVNASAGISSNSSDSYSISKSASYSFEATNSGDMPAY